MADEDVRDLLTALSAARVRYVVVGAYALAYHGLVRATGDIDILVAPSLANARRIERAVRAFASTSLEYFGVSAEELSRPRIGFYMGVEPNRIDIMTKIAGVGFDRAWKGRARGRIEAVEVPVLGFNELISAKRASARRRAPGTAKALQDAADLQWLLEERTRRR